MSIETLSSMSKNNIHLPKEKEKGRVIIKELFVRVISGDIELCNHAILR
jgi:hypothetical protein